MQQFEFLIYQYHHLVQSDFSFAVFYVANVTSVISTDFWFDPITRVGPTGAGSQQKSSGPRQK